MVNLYSQSGELLGPRDEEDLRTLIAIGKATVVRGPDNMRAVYLKDVQKTPPRSVPSSRSTGRRRNGIRHGGIDPARAAAVDAILARRRQLAG